MIELMWAGLLVVLLGAVTATVLVPWHALVEMGQGLMLGAAGLGIPLELAYFALLAVALGQNGPRPRGWYWASFNHHHLLGERARWLVLPLFYAGALSFLAIGLGILVVLLGFVAAIRQV